MHDNSFEQWLANYLNQSVSEVKKILRDETARNFLIVWSIFESKCFNGFISYKRGDLQKYCGNTLSKAFDITPLVSEADYFHHRYQDDALQKNLIHKDSPSPLVEILKAPFADLAEKDKLFLLVYVIYRYRNNMFHGNKGVERWLKFTEQIDCCTKIMQRLIDFQQSISPEPETEIDEIPQH